MIYENDSARLLITFLKSLKTMSRKFNILQVSNSEIFGGNEEHIRSLVKYLNKEKFNVAVALPENGQFADVLRNQGVKTFHSKINGKFDFKSIKNLKNILRSNDIHIIHTHNRQEDFVGSLAAKQAKVPLCITTIHDRINMRQNGQRAHNLSAWIYKYVLRNWFDKIITVSQTTRQDCISEANITEEKIVHIVNGMDIERLRITIEQMKKRQELGIGKGMNVVGMVARVRGINIAKKGHKYFLQASAEVLKIIPHTKFVIVGEDNEARKYLQGMANALGILDAVIFLGYRTDILEVMSTFDIIVLASLFEGLPRTLMEGMALGKPAIGTNVDGITELIIHNKCGFLVEPENSYQLAEAIIELLKDNEKRRKMGDAARRRIIECFDAKKMAEATEHTYEELLRTTKTYTLP